ncbi:unnamed protein product [Vitrella brassicaformis CCMP3155]|uniref:Mitochondrial carrier protein n=1 Tax=Vitrella brassicaformis (strain CCMP3155) TaxID=1169540 RepID=A0A0G4GY06_VITBC|nr:unnamed protein product [Vitrella brassicaformis CCMP3155]|mmetsp:Transcript_15993/g.38149  ORF Transcript_15993/g.38149 Transcript_15993/m.38149 type:complete len:296 (-) Transcript_15993:1842-2729(-)|eukprot:CEM35898.1 unnamed protein product [Vitrella brassicaformis CCMP3155]
MASQSKEKPKTPAEILTHARNQAFRGGIAGASAQVINVLSLMWLRTTMNYQYRYGSNTFQAIGHLWAEGGIPRFYRGLVPALMQAPLSRFGDTAANVGVLALLDNTEQTKNMPVGIKTALASCGAAFWRLFLMPIDAWKTVKQVEGGEGLKALVGKVRTHGITKLYHGSLAAMGATWVGHYPWFFTHNYMSTHMPQFDFLYGKFVRNAVIGFASSVVSDTCSNSIRVIKTTKQTSTVPLSYRQAVMEVVNKDGILGLFGRGLATRILTNGLQGMLFSVGWKAIQEMLNKRAGDTK